MNEIKGKGYLVANFTIHDTEGFQKYGQAAGHLAAGFNGRIIMFETMPRIKEGKAEAVMALMEFDTVEDAERFYNSPEYTEARKFRTASASGSIVIGEGFAVEVNK
ncbi:DUF1330 domain-containing protein [Flavobacterium sp. WC2416]|uniref:DUF1330 domain-containing protein n=1 Tax=Flavobacterium sp. WC2416 TaxID=3234141 RepID=A0AB39W836_9FLAO